MTLLEGEARQDHSSSCFGLVIWIHSGLIAQLDSKGSSTQNELHIFRKNKSDCGIYVEPSLILLSNLEAYGIAYRISPNFQNRAVIAVYLRGQTSVVRDGCFASIGANDSLGAERSEEDRRRARSNFVQLRKRTDSDFMWCKDWGEGYTLKLT